MSILIDWKNDTIMNRAYKIMGVVAEDESFDIEQVVKQRRRRYSITYLTTQNENDDFVDEVSMHVDRWKSSLKKRYELEPIFVKSHSQKLLKLISAVWRIIYSIRKMNYIKGLQRNRVGDNKMKVQSGYLDSDGSLRDEFMDRDPEVASIGASESVSQKEKDEEAGRTRNQSSGAELKLSSPMKSPSRKIGGKTQAEKAIAGFKIGIGIGESQVNRARDDDDGRGSPYRRPKNQDTNPALRKGNQFRHVENGLAMESNLVGVKNYTDGQAPLNKFMT